MTAVQLSVNSRETLNKLFGPGLLQTYNFSETALGINMGTWLYDLFSLASGNVAAALSGDLTLQKEVNHVLYVEASTTTDASGGNLTLRAGAKDGAGTDGVIKIGDANTSALDLAATSILTTVKGGLQVDQNTALNGNTTIGNVASDTLTLTATVAGNLTFVKEANHVIAPAASTTTNANGGNVTIRGGAKDGSGTAGTLTLGDSNTSALALAATGIITTFNGPIAAAADAWTIADPGDAGAIPVTRSGVCNLTSAAGETRTLAAPTFVDQEISLCMNVDGGDVALTVASAFNQAGNTVITFNDAGDTVHLKAVRIASALRWRLISNDGAALS